MLNRRAARGLILATAVASISSILTSSQAQTWATAVNGNWSDGTKWVGGVAPASGATTALTFGASGAASYTATDDIAGTFTLNSLTFNSASTGLVTLAGNLLSLGGTNPSITQSGSGAVQISNAVELAANTTIAGTGTGTVTLGVLSSNPAALANAGFGITYNNPNGKLNWTGGGAIRYLVANQGVVNYAGGDGSLSSQTFGGAGAVHPSDMSLIAGNTSGQSATVNITSGTLHTGNIYAGNAAGSIGTINISGPGTYVQTDTTTFNYGRLGVVAGTGTINISNGAFVQSVAVEGGRNVGSNTTYIIDNAQLLNEQNLLGRGGAGTVSNCTMIVRNNGQVTTQISTGGGGATVGSGANVNASLTLQTGGRLNAASNVFTGVLSTTNGTILVDGSNSALNGAVGLITSGGGGTGVAGGSTTITIQNGGVASFGGQSNLSQNPNGKTTILVTGANSNFNTAGAAVLMSLDAGAQTTLTINNGARADFGGVYSCYVAASTLNLAVDGTNSTLFSTSTLIASGGGGEVPHGTANVNVTNGATVNVQETRFAQNPAGQANILVDGPGSNMNVNTAQLGSGDVNIAGYFNTTAVATGASATLTVQNQGYVYVERDLFVAPAASGATGRLNVLGTASVSVGGDIVAADSTTNVAIFNINGGSAELNAVGSTYLSGGLTSGSLTGSVTVNVGSGGFMSAENHLIATNVGTATVNVDGTNSELLAASSAGTANLVLSDDPGSFGTMNVTNGGAVATVDGVGSISGVIFVGSTTGATGTVNLSGTNSFIAASQIQIGGSGGTLGGNATYTQTGGRTLSGLYRVYGTSTLNYNGGTFQTGNMVVDGRVNMSLGNNRTLECGTLVVNAGGLIDVGDNGMIVDFDAGSLSPAAAIRGYIQSGRNTGAWDGTAGITSSAAAADNRFGVGYAEVGTGTNQLNISTFRGITVDTDTVVVRETYNGDANLDGKVDSTDFSALAGYYGNLSGMEWVNGDFTYDNKVTTEDFNYIAGNFGAAQIVPAPLPGALPGDAGFELKLADSRNLELMQKMVSDGLLVADAQDMKGLGHIDQGPLLGDPGQASLGSAVPEPGTLSVLGLAAAGFLSRRRRA